MSAAGTDRCSEPTPTGEDRAPLRARPSWWPERPDDASLAAVAAEGTPILGARRDVGGRELIETTFLLRDMADPPREAMVHLASITDRHREDITGALMPRVPGTSWHAITYLLPPAAILSYRFVVRDRIPRDAGATREGWLGIHEAGIADPRCPRRIAAAQRADASVLIGPDAPVHPEWTTAPDPGAGGVWDRQEIPVDDRAVTLLRGRGGDDARFLVLLDGERWRALDAPAHLAGRSGLFDILLVDSGPHTQRARDLPVPENAARRIAGVLDAVAASIGRRPESGRVVVAGQSFGGLAAVATILGHPDIAAHGIAQSPSLWFRDGEPKAVGRGDILREIDRMQAPTGRLVVQVGTEEGEMADLAAELVQRLAARGADVPHRVVAGGHDDAWWCHGLSHGLDAVSARIDAER